MTRVSRLAPSPTGSLHLGNARTFLLNWAIARQRGWRLVLRVEDLDGPRVKPESAADIEATLQWLGMDWDGTTRVQSTDLSGYRRAMDFLASAGRVYPCDLTRQQIEAAASAPQVGSGEVRFPPELRPLGFRMGCGGHEAGGEVGRVRFDSARSWRLAVEPGVVMFEDDFAGPQAIDPSGTIGDFVVWTKRETPAYQLAVVVDDAREGVTHVIRGDDLLDSAARQLLLYRALGLGPEPQYGHLPLVVGPDGKRLAKRHGDTRVNAYRDAGVPAEAIVGLVAFWSGVQSTRARLSARELVERLHTSRIPRSPVVFSSEDDQWLRTQA
ncbi:MAG: tRNA glutamyl-Q(34) synthetase GluQRS [Phycisphaerales bacterium]